MTFKQGLTGLLLSTLISLPAYAALGVGDTAPDFKAQASLAGVSLDSISRLNDFSADPDYCAGKLAVASDADGKIASSFDLKVTDAVAGKKDTRGVEIDHGRIDRVTFIVTPDGRVAEVIGGVSPVNNVEKALQSVQKLAANKSAAK